MQVAKASVPSLSGFSMRSPAMSLKTLRYRLACDSDLPLLVQLRVECGWGSADLPKLYADPARIYCLFEVEERDGTAVAGMGCWVLEKAGDPETASKREGIVHLASLFIRKQYQGQGLGTRAMDLLEDVAVQLHRAKWITLDTAAHLITRDKATGLDDEDFTKPNPVLAWYAARGYTRYRNDQPLFLSPLPEDPDRRLRAAFLRKQA